MSTDTLIDQLTRLCRDIARQAQAAGVQLGAPSREDLTLLRAVLNGDPVDAESVSGGEGSGTGTGRCAAPTPSGPQHLEDLTPGEHVEFFGHPMVVVTADRAVVELIAADNEEAP